MNSGEKRHKHRLNLTLSKELVDAGKELAGRENRSLSNFLETLLTREVERLKPQEQKAA